MSNISRLRAALARQKLDGFLVPKQETTLPHEEHLAWLLGFTGSMGLAVILPTAAALFVDGRYTLQARAQVADPAVSHHPLSPAAIAAWLREHLALGHALGYDPRLHTIAETRRFAALCAECGADMRPCADNPFSEIADLPPPPAGEIRALPLRYAGESSSDKAARLRPDPEDAEAGALDAGDSIAWLLNARAFDIAHTPIVPSRLLLHADGRLDWFADKSRMSEALLASLPPNTAVHPPSAFAEALTPLAGKRILLDETTAADAMRLALEAAGAQPVHAPDPCQLPKACKNPIEQAGARAAHLRDGAALCRFLAWLDRSIRTNDLPDEITAVRRLEAFRQDTGHLQDISFDTIAGAGAHGAIMHYRVSEETNRRLASGELFLVDSGGHYLDGTTDVTRTIAVGAPSAEQRRHYTLVLRGHIALAQARFPQGTSGAQLDALARLPLWRAGLDYNHGTGHGVGHFLNVHEGPQRISKHGDVALLPGMIVSNEPGFYREGHYGIRIESLLLVTPAEPIDGGEREMLGFETLTLAPFDRSLIDAALLNEDERGFVDRYHARVRDAISPLLQDDTERAWLDAATAPL